MYAIDGEMANRRRLIQSKLDSEKHLLKEIEESMHTSDELTRNMSNILESFSTRLRRTEQAIVPIHAQSKGLQQIQQNVSKTISAFDNIIGYHHVTKEVEPILNQGPSGQLEKYLHCLGRTEKAVDFFTRTNPGSQELIRARELIDIGVQNMEHHLISVLKRQSQPIPVETVHLLVTNKVKKPVVQLLPEPIIAEIAKVALWLTHAARNQEYAKKYADIRYEVVQREIQAYKIYMKEKLLQNELADRKRSNQSANSAGAVGGDHTPPTSKINVNRRTSNLQQSRAKANATLRKTAAARKHTLEVGGPGHLNLQGQHSVAESVEFVFDEEYGELLKIELGCLIELLKVERALVEKLIPAKNNVLIRSVFSQICNPVFLEFKAEIGNVAKWATDRVNRREYKQSLQMMTIADHIRTSNAALNALIRDCNPDVHEMCSTISDSLHKIGGRMLEDFVGSVRNEERKEDKDNMPLDGTVHSCTSNAMMMVSSLDQFHEATTDMAGARNPGATYSSIVRDVIQALGQVLSRKAKFYSKPALQNIFLLNNYHYIAMACNKGNLPKVYPEGRRTCTEKGNLHRQEFVKSWDKLNQHFDTKFKTGEDLCHVSQLTDKQRQFLKEKFKAINSVTEELVAEQRGYSVPDSDMKTRVRLDLQNKIIPMYSEFYGKVKLINFSSHQHKYMKNSPDDLSEKIDKLFETTFI